MLHAVMNATLTHRPLFARNFRHALAERSLTQQQAAHYLSVSNRAVAGWCLGERLPRRRSMERIVYLLNHDLSWFETEHGYGY